MISRIFRQTAPRLAGLRALSSMPAAAEAYTPTIEEIKRLRAASNAPISDCKKALAAEGVDGDISKAFEWLRKAGIAKAAKKADRVASEGLIGIAIQGNRAAIVEVNSETDFVARNALFQELVSQVSNTIATVQDVQPQKAESSILDIEALSNIHMELNGKEGPIGDIVSELVGTVGEKLALTRAAAVVAPENGLVCSYLHNGPAKGLGRTGAVVALDVGDVDNATRVKLNEVGKRLAMHIVAAKPQYLSRADVPAKLIEKERSMWMDQARESGKPEAILQKMVESRMGKLFSEIALLEQEHMIEEKSPKIQTFLNKIGKDLGVKLSVTQFVRFAVGDSAVSDN